MGGTSWSCAHIPSVPLVALPGSERGTLGIFDSTSPWAELRDKFDARGGGLELRLIDGLIVV